MDKKHLLDVTGDDNIRLLFVLQVKERHAGSALESARWGGNIAVVGK